jgi:hypothetical protein
MAMRWTPSLPHAGRKWCRGLLAGPLLWLLALSLLSQACQKDDDKLLKPGQVVSNIVTAFYVPPEQFRGNEIKMDGEAKDKEWGGPLDVDRPFTLIRLTSADGAGDPGEPIYLSMKAVYTETDVFFLFQWADRTPDEMKDPLYYVGPDLTARTGRQDIIVAESSWSRSPVPPIPGQLQADEDRLTLALEMEPTGDDLGTFRQQGCQVACHASQRPVFGRPGYGRLDVWQWLASRTNVLRNKYTPTDNGNFPVFGIPGYLDDFSADPVGGLVPDPGRSGWLPNTAYGSNRPRWIYRPRDDPFYKPQNPSACFSDFGEDCRVNNGLPVFYLWRNDLERNPGELSPIDTTNAAVLPAGREPRAWRQNDRVTAFYYTYPNGSRADVRGKATYDAKTRIWTLEAARRLRTDDAFNDVQFAGGAGSEVAFAAAIADNSASRHWGSGPQVLRFGPKTRVHALASGNGVGR